MRAALIPWMILGFMMCTLSVWREIPDAVFSIIGMLSTLFVISIGLCDIYFDEKKKRHMYSERRPDPLDEDPIAIL
jgi:UDP-N-acetylmuramyl pentapeptide phosphotransferase/UDP-N-acetylglucosamine-1-phosphate transferase